MRRIVAFTALALGMVLFTGCSASSMDSSAESGAFAPSVEESLDRGEVSPLAPDSQVADDRQVITTGDMSVTVDEPIEAAEEAVSIVQAAGGHVDSRFEEPGSDTRRASANLTLRIPASALDATLASLKELGTVNRVQMSATDVTQQAQDMDARITALETSVDRLLALMSAATDTGDLITIEQALSERQANLESMQSQRDNLADQVSLSTLSLELVTAGTVPAAGPENFWTGLVAGWNALVAAGTGLLIALGVALPWLALLALIAGGIWWLVRRSVRRKRARRGTSFQEGAPTMGAPTVGAPPANAPPMGAPPASVPSANPPTADH